MPKMKTRRGGAKRFSLTATGKIKSRKRNLRDILTKKNRDTKRPLSKTAFASAADTKRIMRTIPYAK